LAVSQRLNDPGKDRVGDAQVLQCHPDGPVAGAVLQAAQARDENPLPRRCRRAFRNESLNASLFTNERLGRGGAFVRPPRERKKRPANPKFR
jgi:hypothetical protein